MKEYKLFYSHPDNPLPITQKMCDRISNGLKKNMGEYYEYVLPMGNMMSDVRVYLLDYLNSALEILRKCKGFHEHVTEYKNNPESTFFVTVLADVLVGHGLIVELEPNIPGQDKKPDLYAFQKPNGVGVYFECKQPKDDTQNLLSEQRKIFDGIENVISDDYSLALFYEKTLSSNEIRKLHDLIKESFYNDKDIYENRCIVDDINLGVSLLVSGVSNNTEKNGIVEIAGIPNFSDKKGYSNVNGINRYGKNIVFFKLASKNTINSQLKNSQDKVPDGSPYVVCIDLSGPRFDADEYSKFIMKHFDAGDYTNFSGVILVDHRLLFDGKYAVHLHYIENKGAKYPLPFLKDFLNESLALNIESRYA